MFRIEELDEDVPVFTTRPDTLFGATFFVLAPEHELVERIDSDEVRDYVRRAAVKKTEERAAATEKTGIVHRPPRRRTRRTASGCPSTSPTTC